MEEQMAELCHQLEATNIMLARQTKEEQTTRTMNNGEARPTIS
jgi:hypothetical protein